MQHKTQVLVALAALLISSQALAFGAIAVDQTGDKEPAYGYSLGYGSRKAAAAAAIGYCKEYGGTKCKAVVAFETCGAYAETSKTFESTKGGSNGNGFKFFGYGYAADRETAKRNALKGCNGSRCKVMVAVCEGDK